MKTDIGRIFTWNILITTRNQRIIPTVFQRSQNICRL